MEEMNLTDIEKRISDLEKAVQESDAKIKMIVDWVDKNVPKKINQTQYLDGEIMTRHKIDYTQKINSRIVEY
jgi:hypothetical protein